MNINFSYFTFFFVVFLTGDSGSLPVMYDSIKEEIVLNTFR